MKRKDMNDFIDNFMAESVQVSHLFRSWSLWRIN